MPNQKSLYIEDDDSLMKIVEEASSTSLLAIDTEFIREKTYYPNLCLIQIAFEIEHECDKDNPSQKTLPIKSCTALETESKAAGSLKTCIIDPFKIKSLEPLGRIFDDDSIIKVFHACSQDLEILFHETGSLPRPIFDIQAAAALLGQTQQAGLASLVSAFLGINIKKGDSFTDWARRPLAASQIEYAAEDVIYLPRLYKVMTSKLRELGRLEWLDDEFQSMLEKARYVEDPWLRYRRLKKINQLNRRQLACARAMAAWREMQAQERDIPRKWVLTDEQIVESCRREPETIDELFLIRGMRNSLTTKDAREVLKLMMDAISSGPENWPEIEYQNTPERNVDAAVDLMTALARKRSKDEGIAMQTLASHSDLVNMARGHLDGCSLMSGWRRKVLGDDLIELLDGRSSLRLDEGELEIIQRRDS